MGGAMQAWFGFQEFFTIVQGKLVFLYLKAQLCPRDE